MMFFKHRRLKTCPVMLQWAAVEVRWSTGEELERQNGTLKGRRNIFKEDTRWQNDWNAKTGGKTGAWFDKDNSRGSRNWQEFQGFSEIYEAHINLNREGGNQNASSTESDVLDLPFWTHKTKSKQINVRFAATVTRAAPSRPRWKIVPVMKRIHKQNAFKGFKAESAV